MKVTMKITSVDEFTSRRVQPEHRGTVELRRDDENSTI
jgi:hypothetical protein